MIIVTTSEEIIDYRIAPKNPALAARNNCNYYLSTSFKVILVEGMFEECLLFQYFDDYQKIIGYELLNSLNGPVN